jgi:hypothetical protein
LAAVLLYPVGANLLARRKAGVLPNGTPTIATDARTAKQKEPASVKEDVGAADAQAVFEPVVASGSTESNHEEDAGATFIDEPSDDSESAKTNIFGESGDPEVVAYLLRETDDPTFPKDLPLPRAPQLFIGRNDPRDKAMRNTVEITRTDLRISRTQAMVIDHNGKFALRDRGSGAGTYLNGKRLGPGDEILLNDGDEIHFGLGVVAYRFRIQREEKATIAQG